MARYSTLKNSTTSVTPTGVVILSYAAKDTGTDLLRLLLLYRTPAATPFDITPLDRCGTGAYAICEVKLGLGTG